jgi:hypothetical protein
LCASCARDRGLECRITILRKGVGR